MTFDTGDREGGETEEFVEEALAGCSVVDCKLSPNIVGVDFGSSLTVNSLRLGKLGGLDASLKGRICWQGIEYRWHCRWWSTSCDI